MSTSQKVQVRGKGYDTRKGTHVRYNCIGIVYNPHSGKDFGNKIFKTEIQPLLEKYLADRKIKIMATTKPGGAYDTTLLLLKDGCDLIVACGGDGTIHETLNGIMDANSNKARAALAVVPMGTGNDFAKTIKLLEQRGNTNNWSFNYDRIIRLIRDGFTIQADAGLLETTHSSMPSTLSGNTKLVESKQCFFMNEASIGISGDVIKTVNSQTSFWFSKDLTFQFQSFIKQFTYVNKDISYEIDKCKTGSLKSQLIAISNGQFFGSGMHVNPEADIDDGMLQLCMFGDCNVIDMLCYLPAIYRGEHFTKTKVQFESVKQVKFSCARPNETAFVECDGEVFGHLPCTVACLAGAVPLIVDENPVTVRNAAL